MPGAFLVQIKAREDSWVAISADGKEIMQDTLRASAEKSVGARNQIVIKTGNVGALDISFNGKKLAIAGQRQRSQDAHLRSQRSEALRLAKVVTACRSAACPCHSTSSATAQVRMPPVAADSGLFRPKIIASEPPSLVFS